MNIEVADRHYSQSVVELPCIDRYSDVTLNDSDKTITVPDGEMWKLNSMFIKLVTTATVGNRQIVVEASNTAGTVVGRISAGAVQAASTTRYYSIMQGIYRETAFINTDIQVPMPMDTYLLPGFTLRVYDSAVIAAAADDMEVGLSYKKFVGPF